MPFAERKGYAVPKSEIRNPKSEIPAGLPFGSAVGLARPLAAKQLLGACFSGRQLNAEFRLRSAECRTQSPFAERKGCAFPKSKIRNFPGLPFGSAVGLARPLTAK